MRTYLWFLAGFLFALAVGVAILMSPLGYGAADANPTPAHAAAPLGDLSPTPAPAVPGAPEPSRPLPEQGASAAPLTWSQQGVSSAALQQCGQLEIDDRAEAHYGRCSEGPRLAYMTVSELEAYHTYLQTYAPFAYTVQESEGLMSLTIRMQFEGRGTVQTTLREQIEIAAFAQQVYDRLTAEDLRGELLAQTRLHLARHSQAEIEAMQVITMEEALWPDSCLGVREENKFCAQVTTPGYRIVLSADGESYEYRTDRHQTVVLVTGHPSGMIMPALIP